MKVVKLNGKLTASTRGLVGANVQEKTVTPSNQRQEITADEGYACLSKVIVEAQSGVPQSVFDSLIDGSATSLESSAESIRDYAFQSYPSLTSLSFPNATSIGGYAFSRCSKLTNIDFPNVTSIGQYAFAECPLTNANFPKVTSIGNYAFQNCSSLTNVSFPNATSIGSASFLICSSLTSIYIPNATYISSYAFQYCSSLTSIYIPNVTEISSNAFQYCSNLSLFDFRGATQVPTLSSTNVFQSTPSTKKIVVPDELYDTWITSTNWSSTSYNIVSSIIKASDYEASL